MHFVIKVYRPDATHRHGGVMSQHLDGLRPGDTVRVKGPNGHVRYEGWRVFNVGGYCLHASRVALVGGGTGITPLYQLLRAFQAELEYMRRHGLPQQLLQDVASSGDGSIKLPPSLPPAASIVFANHSEGDILMRQQLDELDAVQPLPQPIQPIQQQQTATGANSGQAASVSSSGSVNGNSTAKPISVFYTVSQQPEQGTGRPWHYGVGSVTPDMLLAHLPPCGSDPSALAFVCGPPGLLENAVNPVLEQQLGYADQRLVEF